MRTPARFSKSLDQGISPGGFSPGNRGYERIGEESTFVVDITPPKRFRREIVRPKYRHKMARSRAPILGPASKRVIEGGYASSGLITWIILRAYPIPKPTPHPCLKGVQFESQKPGTR